MQRLNKLDAALAIILIVMLLFALGASADCFTRGCEYEQDREEAEEHWQEQREDKYDRWDHQQRKRDPYSLDSPPPPYGI